MTRKELVEKINSLELIQKEYPDEIEFPEEIQKVIDESIIVKYNLFTEEHRWYETSLWVYKYKDEYFGIRYVDKLYSEGSSIEDVYHTITAVLLKEKPSVTYEIEK